MTKTTQVIEDGFDVTGRVVGTETSYYDGLTDHFAIVWNPETLTCAAHTIYSTSKVQIDGPHGKKAKHWQNARRFARVRRSSSRVVARFHVAQLDVCFGLEKTSLVGRLASSLQTETACSLRQKTSTLFRVNKQG